MNKEINEITLCEMMLEAGNQIHPDDIAYLFATGKSELFLRDILAAYMSRTLSLDGRNQYIGREWKRHDLIVNDRLHPLAIIEGKSYIHKDAANNVRLLKGEKSIAADLKRDSQKSRKTLRKYLGKAEREGIVIFTTVLFTVDIPEDWDSDYGQVTYSKYHQSYIKKFGGSKNLIEAGNSALGDLLSKYGQVHQVRLNSGLFQGMQVTVDFFALKLDHA
jgi:hypothetical protein